MSLFQVIRADIIHDSGTSLNTTVDLGQAQGGFIMGLGYMLTEAFSWDEDSSEKTGRNTSLGNWFKFYGA